MTLINVTENLRRNLVSYCKWRKQDFEISVIHAFSLKESITPLSKLIIKIKSLLFCNAFKNSVQNIVLIFVTLFSSFSHSPFFNIFQITFFIIFASSLFIIFPFAQLCVLGPKGVIVAFPNILRQDLGFSRLRLRRCI